MVATFGQAAKTPAPASTTETLAQKPSAPTAADVLRGAYGPYRSNNDLLFYHLDVRVDPVAKTIRGTNTMRFRMLADGTRLQMELTPELRIDGVEWKHKPIQYNREGTTFFIDFPKTLKQGRTYDVAIRYSGQPKEVGRFGGMTFKQDPQGRPWIVTSCEDEGANVWWPNKDQWRDEPQQGVVVSVAVPNGMTAVSNGRLKSTHDLHDGYTRWDWRVTYPINNYDVALNIGTYAHFSEKLDKLALDYYVLPENLEKARVQFTQVKPMLEIFGKYFGPYPFARDGYKLVEVPYAGMEHQSAVAYGNHYRNSYGKGDWTGVGISPRFDFIIIHESGHEWFGNSVTAADRSDMWIHEGFTSYMEDVYVEAMYGRTDAVKYINGLKPKVKNDIPILQPRGVNASPSQDQYFKGALFLNTLRSVVNDDAKWFAALHEFAEHFKYQTILQEDVVAYFNLHLHADYTPLFDAYLRHTEIPVLELRFHPELHAVDYRWKTPQANFNMPVRAGDPQHWRMLYPVTGEWQTMTGDVDSFKVDTESFYIGVQRS